MVILRCWHNALRENTAGAPINAEIRLIGGSGETIESGRLEVKYSGSWTTVCDDSFDANDGRVACRQLGCSGYSRFTSGCSAASSSASSASVRADDLACSGSESTLQSCRGKWGSANCGHSEDVCLTCSGCVTTTTTGTTTTLTVTTTTTKTTTRTATTTTIPKRLAVSYFRLRAEAGTCEAVAAELNTMLTGTRGPSGRRSRRGSGYNCRRGLGAYGSPLNRFSDYTESSCAAHCDADSRCVAFDFVVDRQKYDSCRTYAPNTPRIPGGPTVCISSEFCYCSSAPPGNRRVVEPAM